MKNKYVCRLVCCCALLVGEVLAEQPAKRSPAPFNLADAARGRLIERIQVTLTHDTSPAELGTHEPVHTLGVWRQHYRAQVYTDELKMPQIDRCLKLFEDLEEADDKILTYSTEPMGELVLHYADLTHSRAEFYPTGWEALAMRIDGRLYQRRPERRDRQFRESQVVFDQLLRLLPHPTAMDVSHRQAWPRPLDRGTFFYWTYLLDVETPNCFGDSSWETREMPMWQWKPPVEADSPLHFGCLLFHKH